MPSNTIPGMSCVEINNLTPSKVDQDFFKKVAKKVLKGENKEQLELSVVLVCRRRMQGLNKKYREKDKPTDVLSFLLEPDKLGEIVICPGQVKENAEKFGTDFKKELTLVLIHGILHLLGYDHEGARKEAKRMEIKQNKYLSPISK